MKINERKILTHIGWLIVMAAAYGLSAWSLYKLARMFNVPVILAYPLSLIYDGASLVCAEVALKYARTTTNSGMQPRILMLIFACVSAILNSYHAILTHLPMAAIIMFASAPIIGLLVYDAYQRYERRNTLKKSGRVAERMPIFNKWAWGLHPVKTVKRISYLSELMIEKAGSDTELSAINTGATPTIRMWAHMNGMQVGDRGRIPANVIELYKQEFPDEKAENVQS